MAINFFAENVETLDKDKAWMIGETIQGRGNTIAHSYHGCDREQNFWHSTNIHQHRGHGRGGHNCGSRGRGHHNHNAANVGRGTYLPPSEWQAMTYDQCQAFLPAHVASRIHAMTSSSMDLMR